MRGLLGRLGVRAGIAVGLVLLVLGVVAIARLNGKSTANLYPPAATEAVPSVEVDATPTAGPEDAAIIKAASTFATAWLQRDLSPAAWHAGVAPLSTATLSQNLEGVDPAGVPATRVVGSPALVLHTDLYAQVSITVDTGVLVLNLAKTGSRWLVDGVDWNRS
jgi:hypothetical protein